MTKFGISAQVWSLSETLRARFGELSASNRARLRRVCERYDTTQTEVFAVEAMRGARTVQGFLDALQERLDQYGIRDGAGL